MDIVAYDLTYSMVNEIKYVFLFPFYIFLDIVYIGYLYLWNWRTY